MRELVEDRVGTDDGEMVIDSFALGDVPFQEAGQSATAAQVRSELRAGSAHQIFGDCIGIVGNHNPATFPFNPVQIGNCSLHVQPAAVRSDRLADGRPRQL